MADINQIISLGIGSPASIKYHITFGLGIGAAIYVTPNPDNITFILFRDKRLSVGFRDKRVSVQFRNKREEAR